MQRKIQSALVSVFHKDGLAPLVERLHALGVQLYSTGGTEKFIRELGLPVTPVEDITGYPAVFGGRVKTLHPAVFGGILHRRENEQDLQEAKAHNIPAIDLIVVDLYPFEDTVKNTDEESAIIEKIDIGGISLIRAAAKNYRDTLIVSNRSQYAQTLEILNQQNGETTLEQRRAFAAEAFAVSSHYDSAIFNYFNDDLLPEEEKVPALRLSANGKKTLRYGENPHQKGAFFGDLEAQLQQLSGKEISYNNLVDIAATLRQLDEFEELTYVIVKHTNACGVASGETPKATYLQALSCDPVSAFGGVIATNREVDLDVAQELHGLFFEVLIAPSYAPEALELLKTKKKRVLIERQATEAEAVQVRNLLGGYLVQDSDQKTEVPADLKTVTKKAPTEAQIRALLFANKIVKHTKSNTIVLATENQLFASGVGQTSRVDALRQAIAKAKHFGFDLSQAVMASDAFFPFPDCVEIAHGEGIQAVIQPGGSIKDQASIDYCDTHDMAMVFTGTRHFLH